MTGRQIVALGLLPHRKGWGAGLFTPGGEDAAIIDAAIRQMIWTARPTGPSAACRGENGNG